MGEALADAGIADREEFGRREAGEIGPDAHAADADDGGENPDKAGRKERAGVTVRIFEDRQDVVAHVEEDDRQGPDRDAADDVLGDLETIGEQRPERQEEVAEEDAVDADIPP